RHLADDGDTIGQVRRQAGISADRYHAVDRQRDLDRTGRRVRGIDGDRVAIRVGQVEHHPGRYKGVRPGRTDIEAAEVLVAAAVQAVGRRSDFAAEARDVCELNTITKHIVAFAVDLQSL